MDCFVWRVPTPEDFFTNGMSKFGFIRDELLNKKILRQGWGFEDLRRGKPAYVAAYGGNQTESEKRFDILSPMLDIAVGDKIVIPKLSVRSGETKHGKYFTVVVCTKLYAFSLPNNIREKDFGHFIGVDEFATYDYSAQPYISEKLKSYQKAINRIRDTNFINAIP